MAKQPAKKTTSPITNLPQWALSLILGAAFLVLMGIYFIGPITEGKVIHQSDIVQNRGMAKEMNDYRQQNNKEALWTGRMFGGMPTFQIALQYPNNLFSTVEKVVTLGFPSPYKQIWLLFLGFFVLLLVCGVNPYLSFIGGLAYAFSSYFFIILQVGHNTKAMAAALIPPIVAGVIWAYRGKYFWGAALVLLALTLQIGANHIQVTYYMGIILIGIAVAALLEAVMKREDAGFFHNITLPRFGIASGLLLVVAMLAITPNISRLWTTYEYTDVTMRGGAELSKDKEIGKGGLDPEYAFRWSYGISESLNMLIPNLYGGGPRGSEGSTPATYKYIKDNAGKAQADEYMQGGLPFYWGDQPSTAGPTYIGAAIVFLFVFSLVLGFKNPKAWGYNKVFTAAMLFVTLLAIMLAWGRHFPALTNIFFYYFPLYNKFRAVAMILMIVQFMMPFMGMLALNEVLKREDAKKEILQSLKIAAGIVLGLTILVFLIGKTSWTFMTDKDKSDAFTQAIISDRERLFTMDILKTLFWVGSTAGILWLWLTDKLKANMVMLGIGLVVLVDLWTVNKKYMNDKDFSSKAKYQAEIEAKTKADELILQDKGDFRVLNLADDTFNDALTSFHHRSVGGYHPAKLRRYQDLIEAAIFPEIQQLGQTLNKGFTDSTLRAAFAQSSVLNMLNTKYLIFKGDQAPLQNPAALGSAWFVSELKNVKSADEELAALKGLNTRSTAVVDVAAFPDAAKIQATKDSAASVKLLSYSPNELKYESNASKEGVVVFSEIYYAKGWKAFVDDKETPHFRANWVLRAMQVPAGKHTITFKFEPESYYKGEQYTLYGSIVVLLLLAGLVAAGYRAEKKGAA